jgi:uncharacterized protein (TIGR03382 family)
MKTGVIGAVVLALCECASAQFSVVWDEVTQGDISDDRLAPNAYTLVPGDNLFFGVIEGDDGMGGLDRDYFTITVPAGFQLSQLILTGYLSADFAAFVGFQAGPVFMNPPDMVTPDDLLGWVLINPELIEQDLLPLMGAQGQGFTPPLGEGSYAFWVQQTGLFTEWSASFVVEEVPSPGAVMLGLLGLAGVMRERRRGESALGTKRDA